MDYPSSHMTPSASRGLEMSNNMGDHHFPFDPIPLELFDQQSGPLHEYPRRDVEAGGLGQEEDEYVDEELGLEEESLGAMKEMMYRIAAMQPVDIDPSTIKKPRRRNVRISDDPQSVAARHRRERISERIRILQRLVPGGTKMDTASMLDEAVRYVKFLKRQLHQLESCSPAAALPPQATGPLLGAAGRNPERDTATSSALPFIGAPHGLGFYGFHD